MKRIIKEHEETLGDVCFLDCDDGFIGVSVKHQTLNLCSLGQLYFNKPSLQSFSKVGKRNKE